MTTEKTKTVLKGREWNRYLTTHNFLTRRQEEVYVETHKYHAIYKVGEYFFSLVFSRGYKSKSRLKSLISEYTS